MARVKNPLHSDSASGNVARGALQFRRDRRGVHVYHPPAPGSQNQKPATSAQAAVRQRYRDATAAWRALYAGDKDAYRDRAAPLGMTGWNLFMKEFDGGSLPPPLNQPPISVIDSVLPNPVDEGVLVTFQGHGSDVDGSVVAHEWSSSIDGVISTLAEFSTDALSVGSHTISYRVRDDDGAWSQAVTAWLVVQVPPLGPYVPPPGDAVDFVFPASFPAYVPPSGDAVDFVLP